MSTPRTSGSPTLPRSGSQHPRTICGRGPESATGTPSNGTCSRAWDLGGSIESLRMISRVSSATFAIRGYRKSTSSIAIGVTNRVYRFAARRLGWSGANPVSLMLSSERPKPSQSKRRRIFEGAELEQTVATAAEPWRTLFILAALTGARVSELLALTWADVRLGDLDEAEVEFAWHVDRKGERRPTKTDGSARTVPMPRELAMILVRHKLAARFAQPEHFVFSTRRWAASAAQRLPGAPQRSARRG